MKRETLISGLGLATLITIGGCFSDKTNSLIDKIKSAPSEIKVVYCTYPVSKAYNNEKMPFKNQWTKYVFEAEVRRRNPGINFGRLRYGDIFYAPNLDGE